ncbi:MAG TPA: thiamine-phosphate kinase [Elusimicrobia bacterium]|nr:thiamine-phosphate kinase [Elusimicrobiota bacterium]
MPSSKRVSDLGETGLLRRIYARFARPSPGVLIGPGDDAAALRVPPGRLLLATQDDLVEGTHFQLDWTDPARLAARLFAVNLSDLAAMGDCRPLACIVSAGLPPGLPASWAQGLLAGLGRCARRYRTPLAGGNLARSKKVFLSMCAMGTARPGGLVRRSGARPGDLLAGVGPLGEAAAGVSLLRSGSVPRWGTPLVRAFWEVRPQLEAGRRLAGLATSMLDNSDGLLRSARILSEASGVRIRLDLKEAPASQALRRFCRERRLDLREHQARGGEDYGLVFTVPPGRLPRGAYRLGSVEKGRGVVFEGGAEPFEHFR